MARRIQLSLFLFLSVLLTPLFAGISSINLATIEDQASIAIFFDSPETFNETALSAQFSIDEIVDYDYQTGEESKKPLSTGKWHANKDGRYIYYTPIKTGSYIVTPNDYPNHNSRFNTTYIYSGEAPEVVNIIGKGPVMPLTQRSLPIESVGVNEVDIEFFHIDNPAQFLEDYYLGKTLDYWTLREISRNHLKPSGIFRYVMPNDVDLNKKTEHRIPVDKNITSGAYVVTVNPAGQINRTLDARILFISDIGMHVRQYSDRALVMANYFSTTKPLNHGTLEIWRQEKGKLVIQEDVCQFKEGLCEIPRALKQNELLVAKTNNDISMLPMREIALDLNDFAIAGDRFQKAPAHLYSNRLLYRPSETITVNALLRDQDGGILPSQPVEVKLINTEGKAVQTRTLTAKESGFYQTDFTTDHDGKTGIWKVELRTDPSLDTPNGSLTLHIEEFMPERMELILKPEHTKLTARDTLQFDIASRYLFGAPAAGNEAKITTRLQPNLHPFPREKDWHVGTNEYFYQSLDQYSLSMNEILSDEGEKTARISLPLSDTNNLPKQIIRAMVDVSVLDGDATGINRNFTADFWPQEIVPVVRPLFNSRDLGYGQKADFEIFAADSDGNIIPRDLTLTLSFTSNWCIWVYNSGRGWRCHENDSATIQALNTIDKDAGIYRFSVDPYSWGRYELSIVDNETGFETVYPFSSSWDDGQGDQLPAARPMSLNLTLDKVAYQDNDTMKVEIDSPFTGTLMLLIEGDSPLYKKSLKVKKGKNNLSIKLDPSWKRHDLYLTGLLLSKNSKEEIIRALGIQAIRLDRHERSLKAELNFEPVALPEAPVKIKVKVLDPKPNEKLFATLSITDQGILNMTPTQNKKVFNAFFAQKRYNVDIIDYYNRLFGNSTKALLTPKFGGDGEVSETEADLNLTEMKTVSIATELLALNDDGEYEVELMLPDFNGEAKVLATLFSDTRMNETEKQLTIRAPIIADLITPNFIRVNDHNHFSLSLHNMSGNEEAVRVRLESDSLETAFDKTYTLKDKESLNELIPVRLLEYTHYADVNLIIESNLFSTTRNYRIGTIPYAEKAIFYDRAELTVDRPWNKLNTQFSSMTGNVSESLLVSRFPIIDVLTYTNNLFSYPYGCTEQTTSRAFPWLFRSHPILDMEKKALHQYYLDREETNGRNTPLEYDAWEYQLMENAINRILMRQNHNGGFNLWSSDYHNIAVSSYVADFLYQAARKYPELVSSKTLDEVSAYIKSSVTDMSRKLNYGHHYYLLNDTVYGAWVLAREGKLFSADLMIFNKHTDKMSPLSQAYLGAANLIVGNQSVGEAILDKVTFTNWNSYYGYYHTDVAEIALTIDLINQLTAKGVYTAPEGKVKTLMNLMNERLKNRTYFSTQERYAMIKIGIDTPDDDTPIELVDQDGKRFNVMPNTMIDSKGFTELYSDEPLYLSYKTEGFPMKRTSTSTFDVEIDRQYQRLGTTANVGDRYLVVLTVTPKRTIKNALIEDEILGGFNLINPNLVSDNVSEFYRSFNIKAADKRASNMHHEEFRFDRYVASLDLDINKTYTFVYVIEAAIPGDYEAPNTYIEAMYLPELRAVRAYSDKAPISILKSR